MYIYIYICNTYEQYSHGHSLTKTLIIWSNSDTQILMVSFSQIFAMVIFHKNAESMVKLLQTNFVVCFSQNCSWLVSFETLIV